MSNTVANLIKQLQELHDPNEPIMFQYLVAEHADLSVEEFSQCLEDVDAGVYDELSNIMMAYVYEVYEGDN